MEHVRKRRQWTTTRIYSAERMLRLAAAIFAASKS